MDRINVEMTSDEWDKLYRRQEAIKRALNLAELRAKNPYLSPDANAEAFEEIATLLREIPR